MTDRETGAAPEARAALQAFFVLGIGLMAAIDEIVFHQVLAWHHFYDRSTPAIGLLSDGLLHAAELIVLVVGAFLLRAVWQRGRVPAMPAAAGLLLGLGGFQLFDGIVDHKLLRVHQIRAVADLFPYDLAWNGFALALLAIGVALAWRARSEVPPVDSTGRKLP